MAKKFLKINLILMIIMSISYLIFNIVILLIHLFNPMTFSHDPSSLFPELSNFLYIIAVICVLIALSIYCLPLLISSLLSSQYLKKHVGYKRSIIFNSISSIAYIILFIIFEYVTEFSILDLIYKTSSNNVIIKLICTVLFVSSLIINNILLLIIEKKSH